MKKIYFLLLAVLCLMNSFAVAPLPGSGLQEPHRGRAPFTILSHDAAKNIQKISPRKAPAINLAPRCLLILVNFTDVQFSENNTQQAFDSLANGEHYTYNGATGSCKQYFTDQSNGKYIPKFDVVGPVTLPQTMQYYGANDKKGNDQYVVDFVIDACRGADKLGVNFADYDNNNDGMVDFVYIIYAGYGEADGGDASTIWPHNWDLISALYYGYTNQKEYFATSETRYKLPEIDGKLINVYACSNEMRKANNARSGIGTICHEFSHVLGLPDYYQTTTNPVVNQRETPGAWSLMGYGNYLNEGNTPPNYSVYDKYYLGWIEPEVLAKTQSLEIPADGATTYMLARNQKHVAEGAYRTDTIYYIENRQQTGWDAYLPGHGMLVWRVIFDEEDWYQNCPNDYVARYHLVSAETKSSPYTVSKPKPEVPFPGKSQVTQFAPFEHIKLINIEEKNGMIYFNCRGSDVCGDNLCWEYNNNTLTISGTGDMEWTGNAPWINVAPQITSVFLPEGLTHIEDYAFFACTSLTSIAIPNSVTSIGTAAFYGCSALTSITIPNSVTSIGIGAFSGSPSLTSMLVENGNTIYDSRANCNAIIETATNTLIAGCQNTIIPNNVTSIGNYAFHSCSRFTSLTIPNSIKSIGYQAFEDCHIDSVILSAPNIATYCKGNTNNLLVEHNIICPRKLLINEVEAKEINIPDSIENVSPYTFYNCINLNKVVLSNNVRTIENSAFAGCTKLNMVQLGTGIKTIRANAFANCTKLYDVYCYSMEPPIAQESSFANYNAFLHVPCDNQRVYLLDVLFGNFKYIECMGAESEPVVPDTVIVTPGTNDVTITWPTEDNAYHYVIEIKKDGVEFCTLTFNANGQLLNIAFAPSREGNNRPAQYAEQVANGSGLRFTVTGLEAGTNYTYDVVTKDQQDKEISTHSGKFTTKSNVTTDMDNIQSPVTTCQKIFRNGQLIIIRDGKEYTAMGAEIQ